MTVGSLRGPLRNSISTRSMILKLLSHFHHPMTSVPIGAAGTSAGRGELEEWLGVKSGLCGNTGSTSLEQTGRAQLPARGECAPQLSPKANVVI